MTTRGIVRIFVFSVTALALAAGILIAAVLWFPRPEDTTDPAIFARDGASVDYCDLPTLTGDSVSADDIPKAYTPGCGWSVLPMPILAACTEPLNGGAPDLRGLWQAHTGAVGHIERIEQCGNRVVITSGTIIHDMRADGTLGNGANDINPNGCFRIWASAQYLDGALVLHPLGQSFFTVTRRLEGDDELVWEYPSIGTTRMRRICTLPD
jgi:hypothetical protein